MLYCCWYGQLTGWPTVQNMAVRAFARGLEQVQAPFLLLAEVGHTGKVGMVLRCELVDFGRAFIIGDSQCDVVIGRVDFCLLYRIECKFEFSCLHLPNKQIKPVLRHSVQRYYFPDGFPSTIDIDVITIL